MALPRIIPVLLLQDKGLVKTVQFKEPKYVGDPINTVKLFNEKEVDEVILVDILAATRKAEPDYSYLTEVASECFMPMTYGGGVHRLEQIHKLLQCGIEKVMINSCLLENPGFLKEAARAFGSSTLVAAVDVRVDFWGSRKVYNHVLKKSTSQNIIEYAKLLQDNGAGELFINHVQLDGTRRGYDVELIKRITHAVSVPVIACGGCSSVADLKNVIKHGGAQAAAAGSLFVLHGPHRAVLVSYLTKTQMKEFEKV